MGLCGNFSKNNSQSKTPETETEDLRHEKEKKANSDLTFDVIIGNFAFVQLINDHVANGEVVNLF